MDLKVKTEHEEVDLPDLVDPQLLSEEYGTVKHEKYTCSECLEDFNCEFLLNIHKMTHDKTQYCFICKRKVHKRFKEHVMDKHFNQCNVCFQNFNYKRSLVRHMEIHTGNLNYIKCDKCDKRFRQRGSLYSHVRSHHEGIKPYACKKITLLAEKEENFSDSAQPSNGGNKTVNLENTDAEFVINKTIKMERIASTEKNKRDSGNGNSDMNAEFVINKRKKVDLNEEEENTEKAKQNRKKELRRLRNIKYRARMKKAKKAGLNQLSTDHKKELSKKSSQKYRDKKRLEMLNTDNNAVISEQSTVNNLLHVQNQPKIHEPQIVGPSWLDVPTSDFYSNSLSLVNLQKHQQSKNINFDNSDNNIAQADPPNIISHIPEETRTNQSQHSNSRPRYSLYNTHCSAHLELKKKFFDNTFGHACDICDRLWFKNDLKILINDDATSNIDFIRTLLTNSDISVISVCKSCFLPIGKKRVPILSVYNGFKYPDFPESLVNVPLDLVSERLISPRIPFMQIRRLRHINRQNRIYGQVINVPIEVNTMVNQLPRNVDEDHSTTVNIEKNQIHKSSSIYGIVNKRILKHWLSYLIKTPLYEAYNITIDENFFEGIDSINEEENEIFENIPVEESLVAQQQTLLWNEDMYLLNNVDISLVFDQHMEELSFPAVYLGQFRKFCDGIVVTPFIMATSELRRSDRRGVSPHHLLYMAMKIMRIRVRDALKDAGITKEQLQNPNYLQGCVESQLAFLRSIPNSTWYWQEREKDLFAMIRQLGRPTALFTISANEIGWPNLLQVLYKLKNKEDITIENAEKLHYITKSTLINDDSVTCAIYFNKLVNVILNILQSKRFSPFKKFRVLHYFKKIEFKHKGSQHAHILAWLDSAPQNALERDYNDAIELIDSLISVKSSEASGNIRFQTHKHTFTCSSNKSTKCRFDAPFMPSKKTVILTPMKDSENGFENYKKKYFEIKKNLEDTDYKDMNDFYQKNGILTDEEYNKVISAGINQPRVFLKREPSEKWHNPFNPFLLNVVKSTTDFQFITGEYSCAAYIVEYVNKTNRGASDLQRKIIESMNQHPEFNIAEITKNIGVKGEMTSQEAAWYLLREPMSKTSTDIVYIPTVRPIERQRIKLTMKELSDLEDDCTDNWKENWFDKYEKRPNYLEDITLAQFVSNYYKTLKGEYVQRSEPRIIRYRNYDMANDFDDYRREMVTLHIPFRHEESEVLSEMKFITIYKDNEDRILQNRKEFESNIDIAKIIQICRELC
ncbi:unnamed protein product [Diabrotica balteata]|uniref:C2H2-type domain-containing protein n=1 Tax=Diabrotica balteata TaxID=107213 RepID=A0A9N9TAY5_DIABA|nr:unnamed protein product [Diabrotica balteata]